MHADQHAKLGTGHACRESTIPCYASHRPPPFTILSAPLFNAKGHRKQADGTGSQPVSQPIKRHVGLLFRSSTLSSPLTCLLSLHLPRVYHIRLCARARLDRCRTTRWAAYEHPLTLLTLPVVFFLPFSLPLPEASRSRALESCHSGWAWGARTLLNPPPPSVLVSWPIAAANSTPFSLDHTLESRAAVQSAPRNLFTCLSKRPCLFK
jgi:hypothetical protein